MSYCAGMILQSASRHGKIRALVGGLHGLRDFARVRNLELICPTHCTKYMAELAVVCGASCMDGGEGTTIELDTDSLARDSE